MLRTALASLFCSLLLVAQSFGQEIFVPRELKAVAVNPPAPKEPAAETKAAKTSPPKEVVRRAEPVTEADLKAVAAKELGAADTAKSKTPKADPAPAKTEKTPSKEKAPATVKVEKAPLAKEESAASATKSAKTETVKAEPAKEKTEKVAAVKEKEKPASPPVAKTLSKSEPTTVKVEKAIPVKQESASKSVAKTETAKAEPAREKLEKSTVVKEKAASDATAKTSTVKIETPTAKTEKVVPAKEEPAKSVAKTDSVKVETVTAKTEKKPVKDKPATIVTVTQKDEKAAPVKEEPTNKTVAKTETVIAKAEKRAVVKEKQPDPVMAKTDKAAPEKEETAASKKIAKSDPVKAEPAADKAEKAPAVKEHPTKAVAKTQPAKTEATLPKPPSEGPITVAKTTTIKAEPVSVLVPKEPPQVIPAVSGSLETGLTKLADGFDFPVGKPNAEDYYKARGFRPGGHVGEDWDGTGGGDTDLKDPIYSIGDGIVVFARDVRRGWGNVIIVRHAYREGGNVKYIDALYGHLHTMMARRGQKVARGQQIGTMGTAHGQYDAHLHFEIRKNLEIGMSRSKFQKSFSNYYDPTQFINSHRQLSGGGSNYKVAMNTFTHDWAFRFDGARNFAPRKRSTAESSAALRRALTSTRN